MDPKTSPHSGSQKVRFWSYLLHLSKVRCLRNGPHFGSCLKTSFAQNTKKKMETEDAQKYVQKKGHPPQKWVSISGSGGSLTAPSRARNKKQFEQQQQQQQQQLQQLWLNVDFFCSMFIFSAQCWFLLSKLSSFGWDLQKKDVAHC